MIPGEKGIALEDLGIPRRDGAPVEQDPRRIWRAFAAHYHLFRGTPTRTWLDHAFATVFGIDEQLTPESADRCFERIDACLREPAFRPRALFERFNIEVIATTESPLDPLAHHAKIRASGWQGRVITAYRPDPVVDAEFDGFRDNVLRLGALTREQLLQIATRARTLARPRAAARGADEIQALVARSSASRSAMSPPARGPHVGRRPSRYKVAPWRKASASGRRSWAGRGTAARR